MNILAYIDPATGALVGQILAGVFITLGVVFGIWWRKITTFIKGVWAKLFGKKKAEAQKDERDDELADELDEISEETTVSPEKNVQNAIEAEETIEKQTAQEVSGIQEETGDK